MTTYIGRREFITVLAGAVAAWPRGVLAQALTKRPLIAVLAGASSASASRWLSGFPQRMQELGYVEGHDFEIVYRYADGDLSRLPVLAEELVRLKPDVIVAGNSQATIAAKQATATVPIIAVSFADPVALGLVTSEARPGGQVTGVLATLDTLPEKQLALAVEVVPGATKLGMLIDVRIQAQAIMRQGV
jgi:putative ABC transport system substrate-binding protein